MEFPNERNPYQSPQFAGPEAPQKSGDERQPAGFWIRVLASLLDAICLLPITVLSLLAVYYFKSLSLWLSVSLVGLFYKPLMECFYGGTLGKQFLGLKVVNQAGELISISQSYLRFSPWLPQSILGIYVVVWLFLQPEFARTEGFTAIGELMAQNPLALVSNLMGWVVLIDCALVASNERKQAGHDMLAGTYCVRSR